MSVKLLIIDDSKLVRNMLTIGLSEDSTIEVVGAAQDAYEAREMIAEKKPNVLTLDVDMPGVSGIEFLEHLMPQYPLPVVMISSLTHIGRKTTMEALEKGAIDFVGKPDADGGTLGLMQMMEEICRKVKIAAKADVSYWKAGSQKEQKTLPEKPIELDIEACRDKVVIIGAGEGGIEATRRIFTKLPKNFPPIIMAQHMPAEYVESYVERMNKQCELSVKVAENGDTVGFGQILVLQGSMVNTIQSIQHGFQLNCTQIQEPTSYQKSPCINTLFESAADAIGEMAVGIILTGAGEDGADGLLALREAGARTFAQDQYSSAIFEMPHAALTKHAVENLTPLSDFPHTLLRLFSTA